MKIPLALLLLLLPAIAAADQANPSEADLQFDNVSFQDAALWRPQTLADQRIRYGDGGTPVQFADLRMPEGEAPASGFPVLVFLHGGAWRAEWSKDYSEAFVEELAAEGFATWDVEYRRLGHPGGGYPGTFEDVADALDHLRVLAPEHPLDLSRVIAVGHSAGGHLALWLAGRRQMDESSPLHRENPLPLRSVISLAGVNDLELSLTLGNRADVLQLAGVDSLESGRERLGEVDPGRLLPLGVPLLLYIGDEDADWRLEMTDRFEAKARKAGDSVSTIILAGANHMDVSAPGTGLSQLVARTARELLKRDPE